jgi:RimJ/RimL family protein N-acetyltransferase
VGDDGEMDVRPVTLEGRVARLEPLAPRHAAGLLRAGGDADIWAYLPVNPSESLAEMGRWVAAALEAQARGTDLPFAIVRRADGAVVGSTRYLNIARHDRGLEIGWTWLGREVRRTAINTECKYLLLRHAFEGLGAIRVQLKTDLRNERSQRAIERIGAVREGVLRKHMIVQGGHRRDTVMYSVIDTEWPAVRARLEGMMAREG